MSAFIIHASVFSFLRADRAFEAEINCNNPLGTGGRLAIGFAVLLRALWKGTHHAFQPSKLKVRKHPQIHSSQLAYPKHNKDSMIRVFTSVPCVVCLCRTGDCGQ